MDRKTIAGWCAAMALTLLSWSAPANAQPGEWIGPPTLTIGVNLTFFPELVRVPGYPVYYAPRIGSNYFFYDGMYWVFEGDRWYASSWYDGPWGLVDVRFVPVFLWRVPVRYYHRPPRYFHGWVADRPPHWGEHWGRDWERQRSGWDHWDHRKAPPPAPLPIYQRQYSGERYPHHEEQQRALHDKHYRYQPTDAVVREHYRVPERQPQSAPSALRYGTPGDSTQPALRSRARDSREGADRHTRRQEPQSAVAQPPSQEPERQPQAQAAKHRGPPDREQTKSRDEKKTHREANGASGHDESH